MHEWGAWGQLGVELTPKISVWGFAGTSQPNQTDLRNAGLPRLQNVTTSAMLRYQEKGLALGLEWTHFYTKTATAAGNLDGNQIMFSTAYLF